MENKMSTQSKINNYIIKAMVEEREMIHTDVFPPESDRSLLMDQAYGAVYIMDTEYTLGNKIAEAEANVELDIINAAIDIIDEAEKDYREITNQETICI
jgi:hypothetical protein